jgi:hypothetical protein
MGEAFGSKEFILAAREIVKVNCPSNVSYNLTNGLKKLRSFDTLNRKRER